MRTLIDRLSGIDCEAAAALRESWEAYIEADKNCQRTTGLPSFGIHKRRRDDIARQLFDSLGWLPRDMWSHLAGRRPLSSKATITEPIND